MVDKKYCKAIKGEIILEKHTIIGASSVIMNSVIIGEGTSVGALSFVNKNLDTWSVYAGIPVKKIKNRLKKVLELEKKIKSIF
jgi:galactoside O-acetyltransferase